MQTWDRASLVVWCVLAARTIAFRGNWEGYLWTPHLHADTWYRLTPHLAFIPHKGCKHVWAAELLLAGLTVLIAIDTTPNLIAIYTRLILTRTWWALFLELGASWKLTALLPLLTLGVDVILYKVIHDARKDVLYAFQIPLTCLTTWHLYMNLYAVCVIKKPVTRIQYKARSSRLPTV